MNTYNFCTLFDSYYLTRGLAMYESLNKHCDNFHLYIFAFDDRTYDILNNGQFQNMTVISLNEFENERLLSVKESRSVGEYCWTSTGSTIKYCIDNFNLDNCTYLDADLYFFASPKVLLDEISDGSTLITEHRYTPKYDQSISSGKFCVQFITFHNNIESIKVLDDWIDDCINWCYARAEDGKFGDQKYLDSWEAKYQRIHILKNLGGGVAPWNIQQYNIEQNKTIVTGFEKATDTKFEVIFYHFHDLKFINDNQIDLAPYSLKKNDIEFIYKPYIQHLVSLEEKFGLKTKKSVKKLNLLNILKRLLTEKGLLTRAFKRKILDKKNIFDISYLLGEKWQE